MGSPIAASCKPFFRHSYFLMKYMWRHVPEKRGEKEAFSACFSLASLLSSEGRHALWRYSGPCLVIGARGMVLLLLVTWHWQHGDCHGIRSSWPPPCPVSDCFGSNGRLVLVFFGRMANSILAIICTWAYLSSVALAFYTANARG